jgi:tRNA(adenine34) deaminase
VVTREHVNTRDERYERAMGLALQQAHASGASGEIPIGAVVLDNNDHVLAAAGNRREQDHDPTAHAEILALRGAAEQLGDWRLTGCTLVVTVEPCPMCAGAAVLARIDTLVFGAWNQEYGASGSRWDLVRDRRLNHRIEVISGVKAHEGGALVRDFLAAQRAEGKLAEA